MCGHKMKALHEKSNSTCESGFQCAFIRQLSQGHEFPYL